MKKLSLLVSSFAVVLFLSQVSVAQDTTAAPCPMASAWASQWAVPLTHPGLSVNPREVRRSVRLDGRIATRNMRMEYRNTIPEATFPYMPGPGVAGAAGVAGDGFGDNAALDLAGFWAGPNVQTGRWNSSTQRVTANNAPVINFLSVVRGGQRSYGQ